MVPFWIIDVTENSEISEDFFNDFWAAYINNQNKVDEERFFYYTAINNLKIDDLDKLASEIIENHAKILLTESPDGKERLIKYDFSTPVNSFNIIFIGELSSLLTQKFFHTLSLKMKLKYEDWRGEIDFSIFGLLWTPDNINMEGFLKKEEQIFLNEVHNLMQLDFNNRPFKHLLLFQSPIKSKSDAMLSLSLSALEICFNNKLEGIGVNDSLLRAGYSGIFYEQNIFNVQEALVLETKLLEALKKKEGKPYVDNDLAKNKANEITQTFETENILSKLIVDKPESNFSELKITPPISPNKAYDPQNLWVKYYNSFLKNLKKDLINNTKWALEQKSFEFKKTINVNTSKFIDDEVEIIQDGVFSVFKYENDIRACTLQQALLIANKVKDNLKTKKESFITSNELPTLSEKNDVFEAWKLDIDLIKAHETATLTDSDENKIIGYLETQITNHPIIFLSLFIRALLISFCTVFIATPFIKFIGAGDNPILNIGPLAQYPIIGSLTLAIIPLIIFYFKSKWYTDRINSLSNQYIAVSIVKSDKMMQDYLINKINEVYSILHDYCEDWLIAEKINTKLIGGLKPLPIPSFSFKKSEYFQPLISSGINVALSFDGNNVLKPEEIAGIESGVFNSKELISKDRIPAPMVKFEGGNKKIIDLTPDDEIQLLKWLMKEKVYVNKSISDSLEYKIDLGVNLLLLDTSGSMNEDGKIIELKNVIDTLKADEKNNFRWISFADKAELDTDINDLPSAKGFTNLKAAFDKAKELAINYNKIIIVSDGNPTDIEGHLLDEKSKLELVEQAKSFGIPVDIIYIGKPGFEGEKYLEHIATSTHGKSISTNIKQLYEELSTQISIAYNFTDKDEYITFGELLKMGHIDACSIGLRQFSLNPAILLRKEQNFPLLLNNSNKDGVAEFINKSKVLPAFKIGVQKSEITSVNLSHPIYSKDLVDDLKNVISCNSYQTYPTNITFMLSLLSLDKLVIENREGGIKDLSIKMCDLNDDDYHSGNFDFINDTLNLHNKEMELIYKNKK